MAYVGFKERIFVEDFNPSVHNHPAPHHLAPPGDSAPWQGQLTQLTTPKSNCSQLQIHVLYVGPRNANYQYISNGHIQIYKSNMHITFHNVSNMY